MLELVRHSYYTPETYILSVPPVNIGLRVILANDNFE